MTDRKLLGNFVENPNAMLPFYGDAPNWTQNISLFSLLTGNFYIMDGTKRLKTSVAEIIEMVPAPPETGDK